MKNYLFLFLALILVSSVASASVNVQSNGTNLGPAQDINVVGASVSGSGPVKTLNTGVMNTTLTISTADTIGWTVISSANTLGTSMCSNACVFCIDSSVTVADIVGCSTAVADKCVCAGSK